jgi:succinate dehydrogenase hydrophobic anchor subunit
MNRAWRFVKWFASKCGWFEAVMFTSAFCLSAGFAVGEGTIARDIFWGIAVGVNILAVLVFLWWGARNIWQDFVKHDEKCFDILKQKDIK